MLEVPERFKAKGNECDPQISQIDADLKTEEFWFSKSAFICEICG